MSKTKKYRKASKPLGEQPSTEQVETAAIEIGRGTIRASFLAAIVTSRVYKTQVVKAKKGKGAYQRKEKHKSQGKGRESYLIAA